MDPYPSAQEPELPGARDGLDPVGRAELARDRVDVGLDGAHGHEQLGRDLAVGAAAGDEGQDLQLAGGERLDQAAGTRARGRVPGGGRRPSSLASRKMLSVEPCRRSAGGGENTHEKPAERGC